MVPDNTMVIRQADHLGLEVNLLPLQLCGAAGLSLFPLPGVLGIPAGRQSSLSVVGGGVSLGLGFMEHREHYSNMAHTLAGTISLGGKLLPSLALTCQIGGPQGEARMEPQLWFKRWGSMSSALEGPEPRMGLPVPQVGPGTLTWQF
jgi:hypothetical protein